MKETFYIRQLLNKGYSYIVMYDFTLRVKALPLLVWRVFLILLSALTGGREVRRGYR